jgi:hypothetical protein
MAGRLIARRVRLHGDLEPRDHVADVLIVVSAARRQDDIVSADARRIQTWIRLAQRAGLDVVLAAS